MLCASYLLARLQLVDELRLQYTDVVVARPIISSDRR